MSKGPGSYDAIVVYCPDSGSNPLEEREAPVCRPDSYDIPPHLDNRISYGDGVTVWVVQSRWRWWGLRWLARLGGCRRGWRRRMLEVLAGVDQEMGM